MKKWWRRNGLIRRVSSLKWILESAPIFCVESLTPILRRTVSVENVNDPRFSSRNIHLEIARDGEPAIIVMDELFNDNSWVFGGPCRSERFPAKSG